MTDLHVEGTPDEAVATLFGVCRALSESARAISSAELADLNATELTELRQAVAAGARTADDAFVEWCTRTGGQIVAELYLRAYTQAVIDAKAAAINGEERRLACAAR